MRVPDEASWENWQDDLDRAYAHRRFARRTREEAVELFRHAGDGLELVDEIRWMPPIPFQYYLLALVDYLQSDEAETKDLSAAASAFLDLVIGKLEREPEVMRPILAELLPAVEFVGRRQKRFRASPEIYGKFGTKLRLIRRLARRC